MTEEKKDFIAIFVDSFNEAKAVIKQKLDDSDNVPVNELNSHFADASSQLHDLEKSLGNSVNFLRSYDVRVCQEAVKSLQDALDEKREKLMPKKKFTFKNRKKENVLKKMEIRNPEDDSVDGDVGKIIRNLIKCGFEKEIGKQLKMTANETDGKDVDLDRLESCQISLLGNPSTVHVSGLRDCDIIAGKVSTSVFVDNCTGCTFIVACQQLRVHSSSNCDFYLHVTSAPIIEDCMCIGVAPYEYEDDDVDDDNVEGRVDEPGAGKLENKWNLVQDFNWLAIDVASPNWHEIAPHLRRKKIVDGNEIKS